MNSLGLPEILLIAVIAFIVFVVFGPKNLPKLGKMFGSTMKEVRKGMSEFSEEMAEAGDVAEAEAQDPAVYAAEQTVQVEPGRKVAQVIYEDELEQPVIDPDRTVAKIVYEDEVVE
ncbi:MAG: twin-arginine translocase TatA/TatE family subunit [Coriobacteriia bacterium]|nr:twin-arginine translocase TatA/TatE family subunit [Coriobacteriia bacterium]